MALMPDPYPLISGLLNLERDDTPCMHASTTVSWKVTAPRHEATLCALAFTRPQPIAAHPHLARTLEGRRGPDRRALLRQAAHCGVTGRWRWKLAERCRALAA